MPDTADILKAAVAFHSAGDLPQAEQAYRQVLAADPRHAAALHSLSQIALASGDPRRAIDYVQQAIDVQPGQADYHLTLAEARRRVGQLPEAIAGYRQAIRIRPDRAEVHSNLGALLQVQGELVAAADCFTRAIALDSANWRAQHNLAVVLQAQGDLEGAAARFAAATRLNPDALEPRLALGYILHAQGKVSEAKRFFEEAVRTRPDAPEAYCGLGFIYQSQGALAEAIAQFQRAVNAAPDNATAHFSLATALRNAGRFEEALASFHESLRHDASGINANIGAAGTYLELGRPDEAVAAARRAVELAPALHAPAAQLAAALYARGDLNELIATNRRVLEINPDDAGGHSNLIFGLNAHEAYSAQAVFAEHLAWARRHAEPLTAAAAGHANPREPERRLRIGYVSAHFRHQAVSFFSEPMIAAHDHGQFEIFCYSDVRQADAVTGRFRGYADQWRDVAGASDDLLAELVRRDQIDILVDLAGHIGGNRLLVFARKPAPIQVTYLGYQNTTGMSAMDYRLTDQRADPPGLTDRFYTERLVRLPRAFFCYRPPEFAPEVNELPAPASGQLTFASLNQPFKIRPHAWEAWAAILAAVPGSRLLVLGPAGSQFERSGRAILAQGGIDPSRVEVLNGRPRGEYLRLHHQIDVLLDSFPFNGHTTVCEALWMGVPSVMLEGSSYASRFGTSVLANVGLADLVARRPDEYVEIAVTLAGRRDRLAELRRTMRDRMRSSPLLDAAGFTRNLETAYRRMWHDWCQGG